MYLIIIIITSIGLFCIKSTMNLCCSNNFLPVQWQILNPEREHHQILALVVEQHRNLSEQTM